MNKKYYAVINNKNKEKKIYYSWEECKKHIYKIKNIKFKSFNTIEEANQFLNSSSEIFILKNNYDFKTDIAIYIDGSYKAIEHKYSYGMVVIDTNKNNIIYEEFKVGDNKNAANLRNVAGEMYGAMRAVQYAKEKNILKFSLCYDYTGIEAWARGSWKRNNIFTKTYYSYMQKYILFQKIYFIKIKSHSNDYWNDLADKLAKKALGIGI